MRTPRAQVVLPVVLASVAPLGCGAPTAADAPAVEDPAAARTPVTVPSAAASSPSPGGPRPQTGLQMTRRGEPLPTVYAVAREEYPGRLVVRLVSRPITCDAFEPMDLTGVMVAELTLEWRLAPSGELVRRVAGRYFDGSNVSGLDEDPQLTGDVETGGTVSAVVDFAMNGFEPDDRVTAKGRIDAYVCPPESPTPRPELDRWLADLETLRAKKPIEEGTPTIAVNGRALPVRSACMEKDGPFGWMGLRLSSGTRCDSDDDGVFTATLHFDPAAPKKLRQLSLSGSLVGNSLDQLFGEDVIRIEPMPFGPGRVTFDVTNEMSGNTVRIQGTVDVQPAPR